MLRIAFSTLAARKSGTLGAFAAVSLAVVLVVSCGILLESSLRAPTRVERLAAAAVVVQGDPTIRPTSGEANFTVLLSERRRLSETLAARVRGLPGITGVVADRSVYAQVVDHSGRPLRGSDGSSSVGYGWASAALTPYTLTSGHAPRLPTEVVVEARLATGGSLQPGDRLRILTATSPKAFTVAGVAAAPRNPDASRQAPVFFRDDVAARLSGSSGRVDLLGILIRPGADAETVAGEVRNALDQPDVRVLTGAKRADAESPENAVSREDIVAGLTVFAVLAAFIAIFVVASTFALSVQQRHRELALFRAIGSTPRQVRRMVAGEALFISCVAFVFAAPIGLLVAHLERGLFIRAGMVPDGLHLVVGWLPVAGGLIAAVITTQAAAFASARRASRIRPTDALREASVHRRPVSWIRGLAGVGAPHRRHCRPRRLRPRLGRRRRKRCPRRVDDPDARGSTPRATARVAVRLAARPATRGRQSRTRHARPRQHASQPAPRSLGRNAGDARHLSGLHHPVREIGASAADHRANLAADHRYLRPPGTRRTRIAGNGRGGSPPPARGRSRIRLHRHICVRRCRWRQPANLPRPRRRCKHTHRGARPRDQVRVANGSEGKRARRQQQQSALVWLAHRRPSQRLARRRHTRQAACRRHLHAPLGVRRLRTAPPPHRTTRHAIRSTRQSS